MIQTDVDTKQKQTGIENKRTVTKREDGGGKRYIRSMGLTDRKYYM